MTIRLTTEAPAATPHSNPQRNLLMRAVDTRWFALADFAIVSISVAFWIAQSLETIQGFDLGRLRIGGWPLMLAFIPWAIRIGAGRFPVQRTRLDFPVAVLLLTAAMGVWAAYDRDVAWAKFWLIIGGLMIFYALAGQPQANHWFLAGFLGLLGLFIASFYLLTHDWGLQPAKIEIANNIGLWWMSVRPRFGNPAIHPNAAASITAMMTPFLVAFGIRGWRRRQTPYVMAAVAIGALNLMALFLTTSRGAWVALAAAMGAWILWSLSGHAAQLINWHRSKLFALALLFISAIFIWLVSAYPAGPLELADSLPGPASAERRLELAGETLALIADFPFTGGGLGSFPGLYSRYMLEVPVFTVAHGHNLYLDVALETSPLGLLALLALLLGTGWLLIGRLRQSEIPDVDGDLLRWATLAALVVISVHGLVDYNYQGAPLLFFLIGMAISLTRPSSEGDREQSQATGQAFLGGRAKGVDSWKVIGIAILLIAPVTMLYSYRKPLLSRWQSNLGAVGMSHIELSGWPSVEGQADGFADSLRMPEASFKRAIELDAANRTALHRLGLIKLQQADFETSVAHLEQAFMLDPHHEGIWKALGSSYILSGKLDQESEIDDGISLDQVDLRKETLQAWLVADRDANNWLWMAYEAIKASRPGLAIEMLERHSIRIAAISPIVADAASEIPANAGAQLQALVGRGNSSSLWMSAVEASNEGRMADALLAYHALHVVAPEVGISPLAQFLLYHAKDLNAAEQVLRFGLSNYLKSSQIPRWRLTLADLMRGQQRWDEAEEFYRQALSEDPGEWSAYIGLGWVYIERDDDLEAALAELQKAISLVPDRGEGYFAIGEVLGRKQLFSEADIWIEQALQIDGENHWYYLALANNARAEGDLNRSIALYQETLTRFPDFAHGYFEIALAYRLNDQADLSIASVEKAIELADSPDQWILLRAANIYEWAGDIDRALSLYRNTLAVNPDNEAAKESVGRLLGTSE